MSKYPVLYSFRRCPYAMRARMAIYQAEIQCELREVVLKEKPQEMLVLSNKGTVPVLITSDAKVIDESIDVMRWALRQNDPDKWLDEDERLSKLLLDKNDGTFKYYLDRYKYHVGYPEYTREYYREQAIFFLELLEQSLADNQGLALINKQLSFSDIAVFPFIRQFANVDLVWFESSPYVLLQQWYKRFEQSELFQNCMSKYEQWVPNQPAIYFPA